MTKRYKIKTEGGAIKCNKDKQNIFKNYQVDCILCRRNYSGRSFSKKHPDNKPDVLLCFFLLRLQKN